MYFLDGFLFICLITYIRLCSRGDGGGGCIIVAKVAKFRQAYTIVGIHLWVVVIVANQFHFKLFDSDFGKLELFAFLCALYRGRSNPLQSSHAIAENLYICMLYDNNKKNI